MRLRNGKRTMSFSEIISQNLVMVFDVETTVLLPKTFKSYRTPLDQHPYIIQLSYIIYDTISKTIVFRYNEYIRIPESIEIPEIVVNLTGITKEKCLEHGVSIEEALIAFYRDMHLCSRVIAHNYQFDNTVLQAEFKRYMYLESFRNSCPNAPILFSWDYLKSQNIRSICTMGVGTGICKIQNPRFPNSKLYKWPKLSELHQHLFGYVPENLHDANVDVEACLKCYLEMLNVTIPNYYKEKSLRMALQNVVV
jgi:DNA polymerase III epsilon subunit-like protein